MSCEACSVYPLPRVSTSTADAICPWKAEAYHLEHDCTWLCQERNSMRDQTKQLQDRDDELQDQQMKSEATMEELMKRVRRAKSRPTTSTWVPTTIRPGAQLPSHTEIGRNSRTPSTSGPTTPLTMAPGEFTRAPMLTPFRGHTPGLDMTSTPPPPQLTPQRSTSNVTLPQIDQEEPMDSDVQEESESEH